MPQKEVYVGGFISSNLTGMSQICEYTSSTFLFKLENQRQADRNMFSLAFTSLLLCKILWVCFPVDLRNRRGDRRGF